MGKKRNAWLKLFQDLGYSPQFIAADQLGDVARRDGAKCFVFSDARALSESQIAHAQNALLNDAALFFDGPAGLFDEHGRFRASASPFARYGRTNALSAVRVEAGVESVLSAPLNIVAFNRARHAGQAAPWLQWMQQYIGVPRAVTIPSAASVRVHRFRLGDARLFGFERNIDYRMSEDLKQAGGNEALEKPVEITADFGSPGHVYELRRGQYLGRTNRVALTVPPWQPALFAVLPVKVAGDVLDRLATTGTGSE